MPGFLLAVIWEPWFGLGQMSVVSPEGSRSLGAGCGKAVWTHGAEIADLRNMQQPTPIAPIGEMLWILIPQSLHISGATTIEIDVVWLGVMEP